MKKSKALLVISLLAATTLVSLVQAGAARTLDTASPWITGGSIDPRSYLPAVLNGACQWVSSGNNIYYTCGNVGINVTAPGQRLHLGDGNLLIEGGGETALKVKRDVTYTSTVSGLSRNPIFDLGRIIQAGDGDPELRLMYSDDNTLERSVFEVDRKGIVASVKTQRGSHFEGFISTTDAEPIFRLNSYPGMQLEMGNGGSTPTDVVIRRETTGTLTIRANDTERVRVDSTGIKVSNGYIKLDTSSGTPPGGDCDAAGEVGRMKVDASSMTLYICTAQGWGKTTLTSSATNSPDAEP